MSKRQPSARRRILPADLRRALNSAVDADSYLIAVFSVANGQVQLFRRSHRFPLGDLPVAMELLQNDLRSTEPR